MIRSDIARLRWAIAAATASEADLVVDLAAEDPALAIAAASLGRRTILHATDATAEWRIAFALRPPSVRAFESAADALFASIATELDAGWRGRCATCGQPFRVAAYKWTDSTQVDDPSAVPVSRRGTCAACRAQGGRGDVGEQPAGDHIDRVVVDPALRAEGGDRWSDRQVVALDAARRALDRSTEPAPIVSGLRLVVAEAAAAMARSNRASRGWWEISPRQAFEDAVATRRRELFDSEPPPRELTLGSDTSSLRYPGLAVVVRRSGTSARGALAALAASAPNLSIGLVRMHIAVEGESAPLRSAAARWATSEQEGEERSDAIDVGDPAAVSAAIARHIVAMHPLLKRGAEMIIDLPSNVEALAGSVSAIGLARGVVTAIVDVDPSEPARGRSLRARLPSLERRSVGGDVATHAESRVDRTADLLEGDAFLRRVAELICVRGEPALPSSLIAAYALRRSADSLVHDPRALTEELHALLALPKSLPPSGSFARVVAVGGGRCFVDARAEREALAEPAADRLDAAVYAASLSSEGERRTFEARLAELDAGPLAPEPQLRAALLAAHLSPQEPGAPVGRIVPRCSTADAARRRTELLATLLRLGPRMGLYSAVSPALVDLQSTEGPPLRALEARDPRDPNMPLRARSDRSAYDEVEAILYRRGRVIVLCETAVATAPLGPLLLSRHRGIPNDAEVVRLLVAEESLLPLIELRLERDERLAAAWREGNWHILAANRLLELASLAAPRLDDLEPRLGFRPAVAAPAQLDLASFAGGAPLTGDAQDPPHPVS